MDSYRCSQIFEPVVCFPGETQLPGEDHGSQQPPSKVMQQQYVQSQAGVMGLWNG